jgi:ubiquinone/menaquinone biosynthesis C-methylase UbiE
MMLYDTLVKWTRPEECMKRRLIERQNIQVGQCVLDLGCGSGTLAIIQLD